MPSLVELFAVFIVFMSQMAGLSAVPMPLPHARRDGLETRVHPHSNIQARVVERYTEGAISKRQNNEDDVDEDKPRECNGWAELCDRKYGNVTFLGSHDSFADSPHMYALSRTQEVPLEKQMELGARMLQAQSHLVNGELHFCHTSCFLFDGGTVSAYLAKVKKFMDENPNEVFTFVFTNPKLLSIDQYWKPVFEKSGLDKMAYIPPKPIMARDDWPTLGEMIDSGRRLVVFMDKGADNRTHPENEYILPQFKMMWEDPHNPVDSAFPCSVDRTKGPLLPTDQLYLINHNLNINMLPIGKSGFKLPDRLNSPRSNGFSSIMHHAADCARDVMEGRNPNFVMLDYVNVGFGMVAVDALNGLGDWAQP